VEFSWFGTATQAVGWRGIGVVLVTFVGLLGADVAVTISAPTLDASLIRATHGVITAHALTTTPSCRNTCSAIHPITSAYASLSAL